MRRKGTNEVTDQVFWRADVVEGRHVVESDQQVIDERRRTEEEFLGVGGDNEILWEHFQHLIVPLERRAHVIVGVPKVQQSRDAGADFLGTEVGDGHVAHVVAYRSVAEDWQGMVSP